MIENHRPEALEILPVSLLDQYRPQVEQLKQLAKTLGIGIGWHYLLDWIWILAQLEPIGGQHILDAGAGEGLLQWYLAGQAAHVTSVDRTSRAELSLRYRARFQVGGLRPEDLSSAAVVYRKNIRQAGGMKGKSLAVLRGAGGLLKIALPKAEPGTVTVYNQDLQSMPLIPDNSMDSVVAVSALEHNSPDGLSLVVDELMRVLKPGGLLLATLGAAKSQDWFHEPSKGWCYTETSLRRMFHLADDTPSNYAEYDHLLANLRGCVELRDSLASFYYHSGENGMPWGKWDPQYQPVGVRKEKSPVA